ncbi:MAG: hypothetical protein ACXWYT_10990 [Actinomycetota bacterium]
MSSETGTLEPTAEREILLQWQLNEGDPAVHERVLAYIADVVRRPFSRPQLEDDDTGIFATKAVPGTDVAVVWTLLIEHRQVVLAHVGPI